MLMALGVIFIIYGIYVLGIIGTGAWFNWIWAFGGTVLAVLGFFSDKIKERYSKHPTWLRVIIALILGAALIAFIFVEARIIRFAGCRPAEGADCIIVLGAKTKATGPSREFAQRIRAAASYMKDNPKTVAVLTGGKGPDEPEAESLAARSMMISLGIDEKRILWEDRSTSTLENLLFAKELIPDGSSVVVVSSKFHLFRASILCKETGIDNVSFLGSNGLFLLIPHYYLREFFAVIKDSI